MYRHWCLHMDMLFGGLCPVKRLIQCRLKSEFCHFSAFTSIVLVNFLNVNVAQQRKGRNTVEARHCKLYTLKADDVYDHGSVGWLHEGSNLEQARPCCNDTTGHSLQPEFCVCSDMMISTSVCHA
jgi:hypothetical protein